MDLSRLKWPLIIIVVVGVGWLLTDGGVRYLRAKFTEGEVGVDPKQDEFNEAGLTNLAGFLIKTFRYAPAEQVLLDAMERYPEGKLLVQQISSCEMRGKAGPLRRMHRTPGGAPRHGRAPVRRSRARKSTC